MNEKQSRRKLGTNWLVLIGAVVVGILAFVAALAVGNSQKPATLTVFVASRDLKVGDVIQQGDLSKATVFEDSRSSYYIPSDQADTLIGGWVTVPVFAGQPITRQSVIAPAGVGERLSASLAEYGTGYRLFTIPLDVSNIVSPGVEGFNPGDLIGVTMSISSRPQALETATPTLSPEMEAAPLAPLAPVNQDEADAASRVYPPFAVDLFPGGLRVIATYGRPTSVQPEPTSVADQSSMYMASASQDLPQFLIVLVPQDKVEELSFALMGSDKVYITLMAAGSDVSTTSFSYWDLEDMLKTEREDALGGGQPVARPTQTPEGGN